MTKVFLALFVCSIIVALFVNKSVNASIEKQIDNNFASITEKINNKAALKTQYATSSNPYDYIKENADFENIVNLGNDALPALQNKLSKSKNSGLQEYIMAIAIERIAKVDLKKEESTLWATAEEFNVQWKIHLKSIPTSVETIVSDDKLMPADKVKQLVELGTPAVPFILEKIESGNEQIYPAIITLTQNTKIAATESVTNKTEWAANNKSAFSNLKQYVMDQK
jgi:hypothetical protein